MANISQVQVGGTTYDICDATARDFKNRYIWGRYKYSDNYPISSIAANTTTTIISASMVGEGEDDYPEDLSFKCGILTAAIHSTGAARNQEISFWDYYGTSSWFVDHRRIEDTGDRVHTMSAILYPSSGPTWVVTTKIWANVSLTNVFGNISYIYFFG